LKAWGLDSKRQAAGIINLGIKKVSKSKGLECKWKKRNLLRLRVRVRMEIKEKARV
jgi:hypothetical protein